MIVATKRCASAPGKVVLSGEYAVLDGAPAICMAVNLRARALIRELDGNQSCVTAPGLADATGRFVTTGGEIEWLPNDRQFEVIDAVWRATDFAPSGALSIDLNTEQFVDKNSAEKLGVGSSAAISVALCAALKSSTDIAIAARRAHVHLQGGFGSGVDIACSLAGGLIQYRMEGASVTALQWPAGLAYRLIWTGAATSTRAKLAILKGTVSKPSRVRLAAEAENMAAAWHSGDAETILDKYQAYISQLRAFGAEHELGIFAANHERLWQMASDRDLVYKPCGAGGGDIGVVLGVDGSTLDEFVGDLEPPCMLVNCVLDEDGVRLEECDR